MLRLSYACVLIGALASANCGVDPVPSAPSVTPAHNQPARIELSATPGTGANGGTATITARVQDAYAATLPGVDVAFTVDTGTLSASSAATNEAGVATVKLTADPGTVKVHAAVGSVQAPETPITIQPVNVFVAGPPSPPPPPEQPVPPSPPPPPPQPLYLVSVVAAPTSVVTGAATTLTATVTPFNGAPAVASWAWDCDTTTTSVDFTSPTTASCTYGTAGTFAASVKVTGPGGSPTASATTSVTVTAAPAPPVPDITVNCGTVTRPGSTTCAVSAKLSGVTVAAGRITSVTWDFGDGSPTATGTTTTNTNTHSYVGAATYTVVVTDVVVTGTTATGSGSGIAVVQ